VAIPRKRRSRRRTNPHQRVREEPRNRRNIAAGAGPEETYVQTRGPVQAVATGTAKQAQAPTRRKPTPIPGTRNLSVVGNPAPGGVMESSDVDSRDPP
jgi:hypothetical protein